MATAPIVAHEAPDRTPIRATDRRTGQAVSLVPSQSRPNLWHLTTLTACDCLGFSYRGKCSHVDLVRRERGLQDSGPAALAVARAAGAWPTVSPEVKRMAATYHSIFGGDE
jgi:hypothetical protein